MTNQSKLIVVFGLPGAGKTYVGKVLEKHFGFYFYDGDADLSRRMKQAIKSKTRFTDRMRALFFQRLQRSTGLLATKHHKLAVAQTFIKEQFRTDFMKAFPHARFLLVETDTLIRERRLINRTDMPLDIEYTRLMVGNFERPKIPHVVIYNNEEGEDSIKTQLKEILES